MKSIFIKRKKILLKLRMSISFFGSYFVSIIQINLEFGFVMFVLFSVTSSQVLVAGQRARKTRVRFQASDRSGRPIPNATVSLTQSSHSFPFGCAINRYILNNPAYQSWFLSRFKHTVFENELKWYSTEPFPGYEDYSVADDLLRFAQSHGVSVRGHNVFWDGPNAQPYWVPGLSSNALWTAANERINSVMGRYRGQLVQWDVMNENLHSSFFEQNLGGDASALFYRRAQQIDGGATPFLNDFNTIECGGDPQSTPSMYLQKIEEMRGQGYAGPLGVGLESHFSDLEPNLPYIKASLDILGTAGLPIWVTELDVANGPNQAEYLGRILQELHSHWAVQGIMIWAARSPQGCYEMCLTDDNFNNLDTGNVVDEFIKQLEHGGDFDSPGTTDSKGFYEISLYHGEYRVKINHPDGNQISNPRQINVVPKMGTADIYHFTLNV